MNQPMSLRPRRNDVVDAIAAVVLTSLGLVGFRAAFGGAAFMWAGVSAAVLGAVVAYVIVRLRLAGLFALALAGLVFLVFGAAITVRDETIAGVLPTPAGVTGVVDGLVSGGRRLLTTLPPSGSLGNLLAVPFVCGFVAACVAVLIARRTRALALVVAPPAAVLVLSVLFGTRLPYSVVLQGATFAAVAMAWLGVRRSRSQRREVHTGGHRRLIGGAVMLGIAASAGCFVGPRLPLASATDRFVLRDDTEPPFDVRQFGSPLNSFQRYLIGDWKDKEMFTVDGLPPGEQTPVRLAVLDDYDGVVWTVRATASGAGQFVRVGSSVPTTAVGTHERLDFTVGELPVVWMPDLGVVRSVDWTADGDRTDALRSAFRLNLETSTAAVPVRGGWKAGDHYTVDVVDVAQPRKEDVQGAGIDTQAVASLHDRVPDEIASLAATITKGKGEPYDQAIALQDYLKNGYYSAGDADAARVSPGHSYARLLQFLHDKQPVGNAEQYAAAMAVMARSLGLPARVVMGFQVTADASGEATAQGRDVDAWVEIGFAGGRWMAFDPTSDNHDRPQQSTTKPHPVFESQNLPPPQVIPPEPDVAARQGQNGKPKTPEPDKKPPKAGDGGGGHVALLVAGGAALPILAVLVPSIAVLALKWRRRRRRWRAASAATRVDGGWKELVDAARDIGVAVPARATRREAADHLGAIAAPLAGQADRMVFGPYDVADGAVAEFWDEALAAQRALRAEVSSWRRLRGSVSLASLRGGR